MQVTVLCVVELVVLLVLTGVSLATGGAPQGAAQYVALVPAALAMGLQSAAFRLVPVPGVTTTYFTGTLTSLLVGLVTSGRLNVAALIALSRFSRARCSPGSSWRTRRSRLCSCRSPCWPWSSW